MKKVIKFVLRTIIILVVAMCMMKVCFGGEWWAARVAPRPCYVWEALKTGETSIGRNVNCGGIYQGYGEMNGTNCAVFKCLDCDTLVFIIPANFGDIHQLLYQEAYRFEGTIVATREWEDGTKVIGMENGFIHLQKYYDRLR